jgi:outer membrane protein assembly factor BamA
MMLLIAALLAQAPGVPSPDEQVATVELRLPAGADPHLLDRAPGLVTVHKGQPLSRKAVQRSLEGLYATGRFSQVEAQVTAVPGGVAVTFALTPRRTVANVFIEGNQALTTAELLTASRLTVGTEYWAERGAQAAEAIAEAYLRRGFRDATVKVEASDEDEVDVALVVEEHEATRVRALTVTGDPGLPSAVITASLGVDVGDVLDLERIEAGVDRLRARFKAEGFYRARVEPPVVLAGGRVVLPVMAGARYELRFSGNRAISDLALRAVLDYRGDEALDASLAQRLSARLTRFYRFRGFHDVRVSAREAFDARRGSAALGFDIEEGDVLRMDDVTFSGNESLRTSELVGVLKAVMETNAPAPVIEAYPMGDPLDAEGRMAAVAYRELPTPPPETVFDESSWLEAAKAMTVLYRERGRLSAQVRLTDVELAQGHGRARFVVHEGPRVTFRLVQAKGLPSGFRSDALEQVKVGSDFSEAALERLQQGVVRDLSRKGYLFATSEAAWVLDGSGQHADCTVTVEAGPQVRVRQVVPVGAARTPDDIIASQATMVEGQPLDADALLATQSNLLALGIFRTAEVEMLNPTRAEPLKTVLLKVKERPRVSGEFGLGYFLADGPRLVGDVSAPNLGGRAVNFNGHLQLNFFALSTPALTKQVDVSDLAAYEQIGFRGNVSLQNRGLLPGNIGWRVDAGGERVFRPAFRFTRVAGGPSLDWSKAFEIPRVAWVRPKLALLLQYELEWSHVQQTGTFNPSLPLSLIDQQRLRFLFGRFVLQTVRFSPTLDLRDNSLSPHKGLLVQGTAEWVGALDAENEQGEAVKVGFAKVSGLVTGYVPVLANVVLALSARAGKIVPLVADGVTPPVKRFFLGGATSMRGFNEDQLLAQDLRQQYHSEVRDCLALVTRAGCSSAAQTVLGGSQVPSQGGEFFVVFKSELRFPAFSVLDLGVFFEAGNLWLLAPTAGLPLRYVAGTGLRYVTPIGPLALDLGINLSPDLVINEPTFVVHFNIGVF